MGTFDHLQRKRSTGSTRADSTSHWLQPSRPFAPLPTAASEQVPPVTQEPLERAAGFGHSFERISILPPEKKNTTGLPDSLKAGIERLSGLSMDDVQVHYNSAQPNEIQALAYTQGTKIHVGPDQEQHLAHEAWHVVQQKQGRVQPTIQASGMAINDDQRLEKEADVMGTEAIREASGKGPLNFLYTTGGGPLDNTSLSSVTAWQNVEEVVQRHPGTEGLQVAHQADAHKSVQDRLKHRQLAGVGGQRMPLGGNAEITRNWLEGLGIATVNFEKYTGKTSDTETTKRWKLVQTIRLGEKDYTVVFDIHFAKDTGVMTGPGSLWVEGLYGSGITPEDSGTIGLLYRRFIQWLQEQ